MKMTFETFTMRAVLISLGIALLSSCQNSTSIDLSLEENKEIIEFQKLVNEVNGITSSQISNNGNGTRVAWWKYLVIAAADAAGAIVPGGTVATSISASTLAWSIIKEEGKNTSKNNSSEAGSLYLKEEQAYHFPEGSAAYIHNEVIERAYIENGREEFFDLDEEKQANILMDCTDEVLKETGASIEGAQHELKENLDLSKSVSNALVPGMTIDEYATELKKISTDKEFQLGVDIISSVVLGLENSASGEQEYIEKITNAIASSQIDESLKSRLSDAVSIAHASSVLWNTNLISKP